MAIRKDNTPPSKKPGSITKIANVQQNRIKNISNVSKTVGDIQRDTNQRIVKTQELINNSKGISSVQHSMVNVLDKLGETVKTLSKGVKNITIDTAKASKNVIQDYGKAISEDISFNKQNTVVMALAKTTPIYGYFVSKFMETSVFKHAAQRMRQSVSKVFGSLGNIFKFRQDGKNQSKKQSKKQISEKIKNKIPHMAKGGVVEKAGIAKLHAAEVVMPVEKLLARIDKSNDVTKNIGKILSKLTLQQATSNKAISSMIIHQDDLGSKKKAGFFKDFVKILREEQERHTDDVNIRQLRELIAIRESFGSEIKIWPEVWSKLLAQHPLFRNVVALTKSYVSLMKLVTWKPVYAMFKSRGGHGAHLSKKREPLEALNQNLGLLYVESMWRFDNMLNLLKGIAIATRATGSKITGQKFPRIKGVGTNEWSVGGVALKLTGLLAGSAMQLAGKIPGLGLVGKAGTGLKKSLGKFDRSNKYSIEDTKQLEDERIKIFEKEQKKLPKTKLISSVPMLSYSGGYSGYSGYSGEKPDKNQKKLYKLKLKKIEKEKKSYIREQKKLKKKIDSSNNSKKLNINLKKLIKRFYKNDRLGIKRFVKTNKYSKKMLHLAKTRTNTLKKVGKALRGKSILKWLLLGISFIKVMITKLWKSTFGKFLNTSTLPILKKIGKAGGSLIRGAGKAGGALVRGAGKFGGALVRGVGKFGGPLGLAAGTGMMGYDAYQGTKMADKWNTSKKAASMGAALGGTGSGVSGALKGASKGGSMGAGIGMFFGPLGMAIGGGIGAIIGGALGFVGGEKIAGALTWIGKKLKPLINVVKKVIMLPFTYIKDSISIFKDGFTWSAVKKFAVRSLKYLWDTLSIIPKLYWKFYKFVGAKCLTGIQSLYGKTISGLKGLYGMMISGLEGLYGMMISGLKKIFNWKNLGTVLKAVMIKLPLFIAKKVGGMFVGLFKWFGSLFTQTVTQIKNWAKEKLKFWKWWSKDKKKKVPNEIKKLLKAKKASDAAALRELNIKIKAAKNTLNDINTDIKEKLKPGFDKGKIIANQAKFMLVNGEMISNGLGKTIEVTSKKIGEKTIEGAKAVVNTVNRVNTVTNTNQTSNTSVNSGGSGSKYYDPSSFFDQLVFTGNYR